MTLTVQIIAAVLALAGLAGFVYGTDLLPTERGVTYTIASVIALSSSLVTLALLLVVRRLEALSQALLARPAAAVANPAPEPERLPDPPPLPAEPAAAPAEPAPVAMPPAIEAARPEPAAQEPVAVSLPEPKIVEPKRPRFKLPAFRRGAGVAAGAALGAVVATTPSAEPAQPEGGEGAGEGGSGTMGNLDLPAEAVPEPAEPVAAAPDVTALWPDETDLPKTEGEEPVIEAVPAQVAPITQRPRIDFAPVDEGHRPRKAEPPLAPPRLPRIAEPPVETLEAPAEPAAKAENDPFAALEAEFDRLIPLKPATRPEPVMPLEPQPNPYVEPDLDEPDEALKIALSNEPMLSDGLRPEPPPASEPGRSPLRGGLSGPIELEERELAPPGVEVIGSYESGGARYTMYSDSSVVVEIDGKTLKFASLEQLRDYIEAGGANSGQS